MTLGVVLTIVMVAAVFLQVIFRYVVNNPLNWSEELSRYVFIWACMLGASIGIRRKAHYGLDAIFKLIPVRKQKLVEVFLYALIGVFLLVLIYFGIKLNQEIYLQTAPGLEISMSLPYSAIPAGALLMLLHILLMPFVHSKERGN